MSSEKPIKRLEIDYPEMTSEFRRIQSEQYNLFCRKQHDYGPSNIAVGTQLANEEEIKLSLTGLWFRMNDKIQRLKNMLMNSRESAVKDEPIDDSFMDVSIYGIMAMIVKNGKWGK
jgi:Zn-finger domain-containing protein